MSNFKELISNPYYYFLMISIPFYIILYIHQGCLSILADNGFSRFDNIDIIVITADDNKYRLRIIGIDKRFYRKFDKFR